MAIRAQKFLKDIEKSFEHVYWSVKKMLKLTWVTKLFLNCHHASICCTIINHRPDIVLSWFFFSFFKFSALFFIHQSTKSGQII